MLLSYATVDFYLLYPTQRVAKRYNVFDPSAIKSVSHSVSPVFLVCATPLKPLLFVVMMDIMCGCAFQQEILIHFFSRGYALF